MTSRQITVEITDQCPNDGHFFDPDDLSGLIKICIQPKMLDTADLLRLLMHEYFHVIHYILHPNEEPWLREGLAQWFEFKAIGRFNSTNVGEAFLKPTTPLKGSYERFKINNAQYGHDFLYIYYLWSQCGGDQLIWSIIQGEDGIFGEQNITNALKAATTKQQTKLQSKAALDQCSDFASSARAFEIAKILNHTVPDSANPKKFFLTSTTLPKAEPRTEISTEELSKLPRLAPVVLQLDSVIPTISLESGTKNSSGIIFWVHTIYPYEVLETKPPSPNPSWIQIFFKE
ncbi:MAG: hypothetical protein AABZ06_15000 [Bdellovibrionota bacterium]